MYEHNGVKISWLGHDGFRIQESDETLVIDPFQLSRDVRADYVLLSHEHFDHCNAEDLSKVMKPSTVFVAPASCRGELTKLKKPGEVKVVKPGDTLRVGGFEVRAIPAYNTNKFREPGKHFHPKADGKVGYLVKTRSGVVIYHAGDSDAIPEMENLSPDIALLPVSGTYVMTADEAVEAASKIKPKIAIPMHYGSIVGSQADAEKFRQNAKCDVKILSKE